jgi:heme/copper-type cytochrome/quinol oxidase subunit 2
MPIGVTSSALYFAFVGSVVLIALLVIGIILFVRWLYNGRKKQQQEKGKYVTDNALNVVLGSQRSLLC